MEEVDDLRFLPPGSILHWQFNHFLVFERMTREGAEIVDPGSGRRKVSREELGRSFTGVALMFEIGEDFEPQPGQGRRLDRFVRLLKDHAGVLQRVLVTSAMVQLFALATEKTVDTLLRVLFETLDFGERAREHGLERPAARRRWRDQRSPWTGPRRWRPVKQSRTR